MKFYKYQGAGNDFLIADNRDSSIVLSPEQVAFLCDRRYGVGADGLMLLENPGPADHGTAGFHMTYYNSDGSGGMMCGNGGRCIVAFAADMGIREFDFTAADGWHTAEILAEEGLSKTVRLKMKDVLTFQRYDFLSGVASPSDGWFMDTGTRHFVRIVSGIDDFDVVTHGRDIRYEAEELKPVGANVNFIELSEGGILKVRTYEKGVEDETFACGTGIVASCITAHLAGMPASGTLPGGVLKYDVMARKDRLSVEFLPSESSEYVAFDIFLTGPATFIAEMEIPM